VVQISTLNHEIHTKPVRAGNGHLDPVMDLKKTTEPTACGRAKHIRGASQASLPCVGQSRREKLLEVEKSQSPIPTNPVWVPVISSTGSSLMPCRPAYARALIKSGRAKKRWFKGIFCIKMLDRAEGEVQQVVVGVDPGSKREAMTVQSKQHTYLNVLSDAVTWVKDRVKVRRNMRQSRRFRKTPCRANKSNRNINSKRLPPSTRSRWQIKLNIIKFLKKLYPITDYVVEDIKAKTCKGSKKWNKSFSPLEVGKAWFYGELKKLGNLVLKQGYNTFEKRNLLGFKKSSKKLEEKFEVHNVDSWVLSSFITGKTKIDNRSMLRIVPMQLHKRQLHRYEPGLGGVRKPYGGTLSLGFKRGSVIKHNKLGLVYVGGTTIKKISLHDLKTGERITKCGSITDINFLYFNNWKTNCV
jgi:hypothetical protein